MKDLKDYEALLLCIVATDDNYPGMTSYIVAGSERVPCAGECGREVWLAPEQIRDAKGKSVAMEKGELILHEIPHNVAAVCSVCSITNSEAAGDWATAAHIRNMAIKLGEPVDIDVSELGGS